MLWYRPMSTAEQAKLLEGFETAFNTRLPDGSILGAAAAITALDVSTCFFKDSPLGEVGGAPGSHNHRHIFGGLPIRRHQVVFGVVIVVATSAAHFTHQATLDADGDLLSN